MGYKKALELLEKGEPSIDKALEEEVTPKDLASEEPRGITVQGIEPESPFASPDMGGDRSRCEVCEGLAEAREIHRQYLTIPPNPQTGSLGWHFWWIDLYDKALEAFGCGYTTISPPTPPEEPDISEILKTHVAVGPCILRLTKKEQRRINELAKAYLAGDKLASPKDIFDLADYVECLSFHASPDGAEELAELSQQLLAQGCGPIVVPPRVELAEPEEEVVGDIRRIPLELIDIRPEKYQYRRGGAEEIGLDKKHVQNIIDTFNPARMTPVEVRLIDSRYELLSGHHRLEAFKGAQEIGGFPGYPRYNVSSIPALIRQVDDETARQLARLSNAATKEYTPSEFARIVELEMNMGILPEAIAKAYGSRKVSEIEKFFAIAALPNTLLDILDQPALRKTFTLDHAAVLGHAIKEYNLSPAEAGVIFNRILKEGEYTAHQLERMLKTLGPQIKETQADMFSKAEIEVGRGGMLDALREVMDRIKAPAPPPLPAQAKELAKDIEKRVKAESKETFLERNINLGNLTFEERDRVWGFKPLRELLAQAVGMDAEVALFSAGFAGDQFQVTFRGIPKAKEVQITKAITALDTAKRVSTPYREMVFLVTLPPETVEVEELLGKPQYIPEKPVKAEEAEQIRMESVAASTPPVPAEAQETLTAEEEAEMQERIDRLERENEELKAAKRQDGEAASKTKVGAEAETDLCPNPKCGAEVGWSKLPLTRGMLGILQPAYRVCPECGHQEREERARRG